MICAGIYFVPAVNLNTNCLTAKLLLTFVTTSSDLVRNNFIKMSVILQRIEIRSIDWTYVQAIKKHRNNNMSFYKLCKCLQRSAPSYIIDKCVSVLNAASPKQLRSASHGYLTCPRTTLVRSGINSLSTYRLPECTSAHQET